MTIYLHSLICFIIIIIFTYYSIYLIKIVIDNKNKQIMKENFINGLKSVSLTLQKNICNEHLINFTNSFSITNELLSFSVYHKDGLCLCNKYLSHFSFHNGNDQNFNTDDLNKLISKFTKFFFKFNESREDSEKEMKYQFNNITQKNFKITFLRYKDFMFVGIYRTKCKSCLYKSQLIFLMNSYFNFCSEELKNISSLYDLLNIKEGKIPFEEYICIDQLEDKKYNELKKYSTLILFEKIYIKYLYKYYNDFHKELTISEFGNIEHQIFENLKIIHLNLDLNKGINEYSFNENILRIQNIYDLRQNRQGDNPHYNNISNNSDLWNEICFHCFQLYSIYKKENSNGYSNGYSSYLCKVSFMSTYPRLIFYIQFLPLLNGICVIYEFKAKKVSRQTKDNTTKENKEKSEKEEENINKNKSMLDNNSESKMIKINRIGTKDQSFEDKINNNQNKLVYKGIEIEIIYCEENIFNEEESKLKNLPECIRETSAFVKNFYIRNMNQDLSKGELSFESSLLNYFCFDFDNDISSIFDKSNNFKDFEDKVLESMKNDYDKENEYQTTKNKLKETFILQSAKSFFSKKNPNRTACCWRKKETFTMPYQITKLKIYNYLLTDNSEFHLNEPIYVGPDNISYWLNNSLKLDTVEPVSNDPSIDIQISRPVSAIDDRNKKIVYENGIKTMEDDDQNIINEILLCSKIKKNISENEDEGNAETDRNSKKLMLAENCSGETAKTNYIFEDRIIKRKGRNKSRGIIIFEYNDFDDIQEQMRMSKNSIAINNSLINK